jgi:hypothetical protein
MIPEPKLKQYGYWHLDRGDAVGYWMTYDDLEDAVTEANSNDGSQLGHTVYELTAKPLGEFEVKTVLVKKKGKKNDK